MIIHRKYTFPRHFPVKLTQSETLTKYWSISYGFCKRYWKEWCTLLRHMAIAINQIERKRDIIDIPINNCALRARYGVSNRTESKYISINQIDKISYQWHHSSIKFHINDITMWSPFKNRMPQNFTVASFGHPVSKSWLIPRYLDWSYSDLVLHCFVSYHDVDWLYFFLIAVFLASTTRWLTSGGSSSSSRSVLSFTSLTSPQHPARCRHGRVDHSPLGQVEWVVASSSTMLVHHATFYVEAAVYSCILEVFVLSSMERYWRCAVGRICSTSTTRCYTRESKGLFRLLKFYQEEKQLVHRKRHVFFKLWVKCSRDIMFLTHFPLQNLLSPCVLKMSDQTKGGV